MSCNPAAVGRRAIDIHPPDANNTRLFEPRLPVQGAIGTTPNRRIDVVANIKSAQKRARQAEKSRLHNMGLRSKMRTQIKNVLKAIEKGDKAEADAAYKEAVPVIDSMINKGIVTKNKAARHKSRLNARVKALSA